MTLTIRDHIIKLALANEQVAITQLNIKPQVIPGAQHVMIPKFLEWETFYLVQPIHTLTLNPYVFARIKM